MAWRHSSRKLALLALWLLLGIAATGCQTTQHPFALPPPAPDAPHELNMLTHPTYVIEAPDILLVDVIRLVPKPPYRIEPLDSIVVQAGNVLPDEPISGLYPITPEGTVVLGPSYGAVRVAGLTLEQAQQAILKQLKEKFKNATAYVALGQTRAGQQIRGEHLVRSDGMIGLGVYGSVFVSGHTLAEAKALIEEHLSQYLEAPQVSVDVYSFNSKHYYIIAPGAGFGEPIYRFPTTGNETVLDALSLISGLPIVSSNKRIWVARPSPDGGPCQILPVDYVAITRHGDVSTNYQLMPNDRLFIDDNKLIALDTQLARIISPIERVFGVTLLGNATIRSFERNRNGNGTSSGIGF